MSCPHSNSCPLFEKFTQNSLLEFWKERFCDKDDKWPDCARYKLSEAGKPVPLTLMPNGSELGKKS